MKSINLHYSSVTESNFTINFSVIYENSIHGIVVYRMYVRLVTTYNSCVSSRYDHILLKVIRAEFVMTIVGERKIPPNKCHWMSTAIYSTNVHAINS